MVNALALAGRRAVRGWSAAAGRCAEEATSSRHRKPRGRPGARIGAGHAQQAVRENGVVLLVEPVQWPPKSPWSLVKMTIESSGDNSFLSYGDAVEHPTHQLVDLRYHAVVGREEVAQRRLVGLARGRAMGALGAEGQRRVAWQCAGERSDSPRIVQRKEGLFDMVGRMRGREIELHEERLRPIAYLGEVVEGGLGAHVVGEAGQRLGDAPGQAGGVARVGVRTTTRWRHRDGAISDGVERPFDVGVPVDDAVRLVGVVEALPAVVEAEHLHDLM